MNRTLCRFALIMLAFGTFCTPRSLACSCSVLDGSIAQTGTQYLLTLKAINCASGNRWPARKLKPVTRTTSSMLWGRLLRTFATNSANR